jgi:hypothetical protein
VGGGGGGGGGAPPPPPAVDNRCGDNGVLQRSQVHMMLLVQRTVFFTTLCIMLLTQPSVKCSFCSCVD